MALKRGPCRIVSASIAALAHVLIEVEPGWRISNEQDVLQVRSDVMQELYFPSEQLARALVLKQQKHVQLRLNVQEQLKDLVSPEHRLDHACWEKC
jgi:hypothetical protein